MRGVPVDGTTGILLARIHRDVGVDDRWETSEPAEARAQRPSTGIEEGGGTSEELRR
jgi:hypothetical protein